MRSCEFASSTRARDTINLHLHPHSNTVRQIKIKKKKIVRRKIEQQKIKNNYFTIGTNIL